MILVKLYRKQSFNKPRYWSESKKILRMCKSTRTITITAKWQVEHCFIKNSREVLDLGIIETLSKDSLGSLNDSIYGVSVFLPPNGTGENSGSFIDNNNKLASKGDDKLSDIHGTFASVDYSCAYFSAEIASIEPVLG